MARPPARAGGRGDSLTGGTSGIPKGFSLPSSKGYLPTSPARPAGGRAVTGLSLGGPQARYPVRSTASPKQPHQRRGSRGRNLLPRGFFPPFLPKKWGPGRAGPVPCRSNGAGRPPQAPPPGRQPLPSISTVPGQTAPDRQTAGFPLGKPAVAFCHGISAQALARNFSSRSSPSLMFSMDTAKDHRT